MHTATMGMVRKQAEPMQCPTSMLTMLPAMTPGQGYADKVLVTCSEEHGEHLREQISLGPRGAARGNSVSTGGEEPRRRTRQTFLTVEQSGHSQGQSVEAPEVSWRHSGLPGRQCGAVRGHSRMAVEWACVLGSYTFPGSHPGFAYIHSGPHPGFTT